MILYLSPIFNLMTFTNSCPTEIFGKENTTQVVKLLIYLQVQNMVSEETSCKINNLFLEERKNHATGGRVATYHQRSGAELGYQKSTEHLLIDENCFKAMVVCTVIFRLPNFFDYFHFFFHFFQISERVKLSHFWTISYLNNWEKINYLCINENREIIIGVGLLFL